MITQTTTLTCKFKDTLGTSKLITVDNPIENITTEQINEFMKAAIESNVLIVSEKQPEVSLLTIEGASITNKTVENLELN